MPYPLHNPLPTSDDLELIAYVLAHAEGFKPRDLYANEQLRVKPLLADYKLAAREVYRDIHTQLTEGDL